MVSNYWQVLRRHCEDVHDHILAFHLSHTSMCVVYYLCVHELKKRDNIAEKKDELMMNTVMCLQTLNDEINQLLPSC